MRGTGPVLVLIHGMSSKVEHWLGFDQELAKDFRVITFNHRGFGDAARPSTWTMTIEQLADDVLNILDQLQVEKAHLFGISMGGMVAMAFGLQHPHRCASLTIVNSSIGSHLNRLAPYRIQHLASTAKQLINPSLRIGFWERRVSLFLGRHQTDKERQALAATLLEINRAQKSRLSNRLKQFLAISRFSCEERLKEISVPTLIVKSTHDHIVPPSHSDFLARTIPGAELIVIENGGHVPVFDRADEVRDILVRWVARIEEATPTEAASS